MASFTADTVWDGFNLKPFEALPAQAFAEGAKRRA
jgi:hypothetical protein